MRKASFISCWGQTSSRHVSTAPAPMLAIGSGHQSTLHLLELMPISSVCSDQASLPGNHMLQQLGGTPVSS